MTAPEPAGALATDEVRIVAVDDGDPTPVNALLRDGWRLLACGVVERRRVAPDGQPASDARCTFILGRSRAEQVLAAATEVVQAAEAGAAGAEPPAAP